MIRRRAFVAGGVALLVTPLGTRAQQAHGVRRIGILGTGHRPLAGEFARSQFVVRLTELGWTEGQNIAIERAYAEGRVDRLPELGAGLVRGGVEVIVAMAPEDVAAAMKATGVIPIVMVWPGDPVALGFVQSLARPGGNVTGLSWAPDIAVTEKAVEILKEAVPSVVRIAVLWNRDNRSHALYLQACRRAIGRMGARYVSLAVQRAEDFEDAFTRAHRERADAVVVFPDPLTVPNHKRITDLALAHRLPTMVTSRLRFDDALLVFGAKVSENLRLAAEYVDRLLRGAQPGSLPVQQPTAVELVVNLKVAKALGLTIPQSVLLRADQVIE